jgi:hypothetical protein
MSFRLAIFYALFLAGLLSGLSVLAQTNSAPAEQPIIFSSPDGESVSTVSNALLPAVEAPAPSPWADLQSEVPETIAYPRAPVRGLMGGPHLLVPHNNQSLLDEDGTSVATPSQIMGIPTLHDIFGLPKPYVTYDQKKDNDAEDNELSQGTRTNSDSSEHADWEKILSGDADQSVFGPDKPRTKNSHPSSGFFDTAATETSVKNLQDQYEQQEDSVFSSSPFGQTTAEQAAFDPPAPSPDTEAPAPALTSAFSQAAPSFTSAFSSEMNSQTPFALPKSAGLGSLPQAPSLPVAVFQNSVAPPPAAPSWMPKPAPWLSQMPELGTMPQRKF